MKVGVGETDDTLNNETQVRSTHQPHHVESSSSSTVGGRHDEAENGATAPQNRIPKLLLWLFQLLAARKHRCDSELPLHLLQFGFLSELQFPAVLDLHYS